MGELASDPAGARSSADENEQAATRDDRRLLADNVPPAWIEPVDLPRIQSDSPESIERKHRVVTAVEVDELAGRIEAEAAGVDDPAILAEWTVCAPSAVKLRTAP